MLAVRLLCLVSLCSLFGLARAATPTAAAQRQDNEFIGVDGNTYESPTYGYTLEWDEDLWTVEDSTSENETDNLYLRSDDSLLLLQGLADYGGDPDACLDDTAGILAKGDGVDDWAPLEDRRGDPVAGSERGRAWAAFTLTYTSAEGDEFDDVDYVECRTVVQDEAVLIAIDVVAADQYDDEVDLVADVLDSLELAAQPEPTEELERPDNTETYESPNYEYQIDYDPDTWEIVRDDDDEDDRYDRFTVNNGVSTVFIIGDPDYDDDELPDCVDDYRAGLEQADGVDELEPVDDRDAEGSEDDRACATYSYTFTPDGGDEEDWMRYIECQSNLIGVTLVIMQDSPVDDYEDEVAAREDLVLGIEFTVDEVDEDEPTEEATEETAEETAEEATYESPTYGYTLTYDPDTWEIAQEDADEDDPYDLIEFSNGPSLIYVVGNPDYAEDELDTCIDDYVDGLRQADDSDNVKAIRGRDAAGSEADRAWATYSYTYTGNGDEEVDWIRYYECRALGDGVTLVIAHDASPDDYDDEVSAREDLLAGLELP